MGDGGREAPRSSPPIRSRLVRPGDRQGRQRWRVARSGECSVARTPKGSSSRVFTSASGAGSARSSDGPVPIERPPRGSAPNSRARWRASPSSGRSPLPPCLRLNSKKSFLAFLDAKHGAETIRGDEHRVDRIVKHFGTRPLRDVTSGDVQDLLTALKTEGLATGDPQPLPLGRVAPVPLRRRQGSRDRESREGDRPSARGTTADCFRVVGRRRRDPRL